MTDADTTLDDYVDPAPVLSPADMMAQAREAALMPKPPLAEMIETLSTISYEIEGFQERCVAGGFNASPEPSRMRRAAVLTACANFLALIETKKAAVAQVLRGRS